MKKILTAGVLLLGAGQAYADVKLGELDLLPESMYCKLDTSLIKGEVQWLSNEPEIAYLQWHDHQWTEEAVAAVWSIDDTPTTQINVTAEFEGSAYNLKREVLIVHGGGGVESVHAASYGFIDGQWRLISAERVQPDCGPVRKLGQ